MVYKASLNTFLIASLLFFTFIRCFRLGFLLIKEFDFIAYHYDYVMRIKFFDFLLSEIIDEKRIFLLNNALQNLKLLRDSF